MTIESNKIYAPENALGTRLLDLPILVIVAVGLLWLVVGTVSLLWLAAEVPLTQTDLNYASWLGSPTVALHFTTGLMGPLFFGFFALCGLHALIFHQKILPLFVVALMSTMFFVGGSEQAAVRIGLLEGTIRIGCYVPETKECRQMLGMPDNGYLSRYNEDGTDATWYLARLKEATIEVSGNPLETSLPLTPLVRAPLFIGKAETLRKIVEAQRAEVDRLKMSEARRAVVS